jgi:hypothetical protein
MMPKQSKNTPGSSQVQPVAANLWRCKNQQMHPVAVFKILTTLIATDYTEGR